MIKFKIVLFRNNAGNIVGVGYSTENPMNRGVVALVTGGASGLGLATVRHVIKTGGKALIADLPGSKGSSIAEEMSENCRYGVIFI